MANHKLSLEAPDTVNGCILRLQDTSIYNTDISIKCPVLLVTVPGFGTPQVVDNVEPNFSLNLTACDLKVQSVNCGTNFNDLPDGIYIIKWSISPNEYVYVEYNHMRITKALNKIKSVYCELDMGACQPELSVEKKLREVRDLQDMFFAAKAKVENCKEASAGLEIYKYAFSRLEKMMCRTGCGPTHRR